MKFRLAPVVVACVALIGMSARADGPSETWIAKARAALGSEAALNAVKSVHYTGTLETTEKVPSKADATVMVEQPLRLAIDIVFQKSFQQRNVLKSDKVIETTALDDYDGWVRRAEAGNEARFQLNLLDAGQIKRLRANTWENLSFFRGLEKLGGSVEFQGDATVEGKACVKIAFKHSADIVFTRYFEKGSGLLIKTVTENGGEIREEGENMVAGIRFPRRLLNKAPNGQITTITFDSIKVNEAFSSADFAVPALVPVN